VKNKQGKNKSFLKNLARQKGTFQAKANEIILYGTIGSWWDDLEALRIIESINNMSGDITVRINSGGGDVFDGIAIMNALKQHDGEVTVLVEGLAASIASVIAIGSADKLIMGEGSYLMIHEPWTIEIGNADDLEASAGVLRQLTTTLAEIYSKRCDKTIDEILELMKAETWFDAKTAIEMGFADSQSDEKLDEADISNIDLSAFNNVPKKLRATKRAGKPTSIRDLENVLRNAGFSRSEAKAVASNGFSALNQRDVEADAANEKLVAEIKKELKNRAAIIKRSN
jgi:ATP-dependent Clp protease protease subunit